VGFKLGQSIGKCLEQSVDESLVESVRLYGQLAAYAGLFSLADVTLFSIW